MGYSNPEFQTRQTLNVGVITGTATASGTNVLTAGDLKLVAPSFTRKTKVNSFRIQNAIATPANWTALTAIVKNGTSTMGTRTGLAAGTAGQVFSVTLTGSLCTFTADSGLTVTLDGTSTASGQSLGTFDIFAETQELYA